MANYRSKSAHFWQSRITSNNVRFLEIVWYQWSY